MPRVGMGEGFFLRAGIQEFDWRDFAARLGQLPTSKPKRLNYRFLEGTLGRAASMSRRPYGRLQKRPASTTCSTASFGGEEDVVCLHWITQTFPPLTPKISAPLSCGPQRSEHPRIQRLKGSYRRRVQMLATARSEALVIQVMGIH